MRLVFKVYGSGFRVKVKGLMFSVEDSGLLI
jgi:hypothetical protein